jgi:hypothetical protein
MKQMNIDSIFIQAMKTLHNSSMAVVEINGFLSEVFQVKSGVRQGCPIAPFLFALTTEPLRSTIELDTSFNGLKIKEIRLTLSLFADDTSAYLGCDKDFTVMFHHLNRYSMASGVLLNKDKTTAIIIGKGIELPQDIHQIGSNEIERFLGASIGYGNCKFKDLKSILDQIEQKCLKWSAACLSQFGRAMVANASILSHIWYTAQVSDYSSQDIAQIQKKIWKFIDGKGTRDVD